MIAYTNYSQDQRVRREAETLATVPGNSVYVLGLRSQSSPRTYSLDNVKVIEVNESKYNGKKKAIYLISYFRFMILCFFCCLKLLHSKNIDIVHVHNMPNFLIFAAIIPRLLGKKLVLDIHDTIPETYAAKFNLSASSVLFKLFILEESLCCFFTHKIICVNHVQRDLLIRRGIPAKKIIISLNIPDSKRFKINNHNKGIKKNRDFFRMIYHGTVEKYLGIDLTVGAVSLVSNDIPNLEFYIWGKSGNYFDEIADLIKNLGVSNRIHLLKGGVPYETIPDQLQNMDVGILGNRQNSATEIMLPVKMLEYIVLGIPVIAPRLKGIEYYFSENMVSYYEPENINSMATAILKLYRDKRMRIHQAEKARIFFNKYGWDKHKMELINLYKSL